MAWWKILTLIGLLLNLVGVLLLFFFVIPQRMRTKGVVGVSFYNPNLSDQKALKTESLWDILSGIGLACVILGIILQFYAILISP
jgi:hypothetical protein